MLIISQKFLSVQISRQDTIATRFLCLINLEWSHNHQIHNLEALSYKPLLDETKEKVNELFASGCTPALAHHRFIAELRAKCENDKDFHLKKSDRSVCPRRRDFNSLFRIYTRYSSLGDSSLMTFYQILRLSVRLIIHLNKLNSCFV